MSLLEDIAAAIRAGNYESGAHIGARAQKRRIAPEYIEHGIGNDAPEIIEPYPDDARGPCCLIRGELITGDVIHVCVGYSQLRNPAVPTGEASVFLMTCYWPDPAQWDAAFRVRKVKKR